MGNFLAGGDTNANQPTVYTGIDVQTSAQGVPIALVWGHKRVGVNLIWYGDFLASPAGGKKGGKGASSKGSGIYNYSAAVVMALGEGMGGTSGVGLGGQAIGTVWQDKTITTLANLGFTFFDGTDNQAAWSFLTSNFPSQALTYDDTAYLANSAYQLGESPNLPNHNFEWRRSPPTTAAFSGSQGPYGNVAVGCGYDADVNPAIIIFDFLTNPQYNVGLTAAEMDASSGTAGLALLGRYCAAQWISLSPDLTDQEQCSQTLDRWAQLTNCWIFWSGRFLRVVPLCDTPVNPSTMGTVTDVIVSAVPLCGAPTTNYFLFTGQPTYVSDGGVMFTDTNTAAGSAGATVAPGQGQYGILPSGGGNPQPQYYFNAADAGRPLIITYDRQFDTSGVNTFIPNVTPLFNFTYDDFIEQKGTPPITVTRSDPADAPNHVKLEFKDRNNAYNSGIAEWKDQGLVDQFGQIDSPVTEAHEICEIGVAMRVAQILGQRYAYIRNTYEFKLGWEYGSLLEPGDIVTLTDPHIGISEFPVRIRTLDEDDQGQWDITAEEFPGGLSDTSGTQIVGGSPVNTTVNPQVKPGDINPPAVFEPASTLTNGIAQLWIAASGGANWGGCGVYISFDGTTYTSIGTITMSAAQGLITASLPSHADPDTADTLSVDTTESQQVLNEDTTHADADAFRTLALLTPTFTSVCPATSVSEVIAYGLDTPTGTFTANLTYLRRGLFGSSPQAFSSGEYFSAFKISSTTAPGNSMLAYDLPAQYIGVTLYLKFPSFNRFANGAQSLADVSAYTYTPTGAGFGGGAGGVPTAPTGLAVTAGLEATTLQWTANPKTDNVTSYLIFAAPGLSQPFSSAVEIGTSNTNNFTAQGLTGGAGYTYFVEAVNAVGDSLPSSGVNGTAGSVPTPPPATTTIVFSGGPTTPTTFGTAGTYSNLVSWTVMTSYGGGGISDGIGSNAGSGPDWSSGGAAFAAHFSAPGASTIYGASGFPIAQNSSGSVNSSFDIYADLMGNVGSVPYASYVSVSPPLPIAGFSFTMYGAFAGMQSGQTAFIGLAAASGGSISGSQVIADLLNMIGFGVDTADTLLYLFYNNGSGTATKVSTGITFANLLQHIFQLVIQCDPVGNVSVSFADLEPASNAGSYTGTIGSGTSKLPAPNVLIQPHLYLSNGPSSTGLVNLGIHSLFTTHGFIGG